STAATRYPCFTNSWANHSKDNRLPPFPCENNTNGNCPLLSCASRIVKDLLKGENTLSFSKMASWVGYQTSVISFRSLELSKNSNVLCPILLLFDGASFAETILK